ncbi:MATE family efflux transporter [Hoeflea sp. G2-23]|uniref:Multidrug export protein MepA n=1 Tax=Hoeflea algicola TaxID=2983763 RepID=A0ABT3ZAI0_9HYPH|nr:MATE family efflux transporter [Hoeflea algicola]MCY0148797.1 MATE family efflux transporter [Hoeflea algicola]
MSDSSRNPFLDGPLPAIFVKTALPIIFVMGMNGLLTVADALFLGHYVGDTALAAVTVVFPLYMLIVAVATMVASGMASLLARHLGGKQLDAAQQVFASAHWLALAAGAVLIALYVLFGGPVIALAAGGNQNLATLATSYLQILVLFSPLLFILSVQSDALRSEGHVGFMAAASLTVSLSNIGFNYLLIAVFDFGVPGSAYGTVLAQALALIIILAYRSRGQTLLRPTSVLRHVTTTGWGKMLALGAPQGLNFVGIALVSSAILLALQLANTPHYAATVTAYGIVTRVLTFAILPVLGLSQAMQTVTGNNYGAGLWRRTNASLLLALGIALLFCIAVQATSTIFAGAIGAAFVNDPQVVTEIVAIMPAMVMLYFLSGPHIMLAAHFQAVGDAPRAAILGLSKPYLFMLPLIFALPYLFGVHAIWWATPTAEALLAIVAVLVLWQSARRRTLRWGLFVGSGGGTA